MKIEITPMEYLSNHNEITLDIIINTKVGCYCYMERVTLDQIEDLELNLTDIIKQLQDYRMKQNHDKSMDELL